MKPLYNQVEKLKNDYKTNEASISFLYVKEEDYSLYRKNRFDNERNEKQN